ncbi:MAG: hypothetical protein RI906_2795 [Pseudomonadota bacterium]|jgi:hypothetical protein
MPTPMPADTESSAASARGLVRASNCATHLERATGFATGLGATLLVTLPTRASAHPGDHGHDWLMAAWHLLSEPDHLAGIFVAIAAGLYALRWARARRARHNPPGH